jgi:hypothetical protein
MHGKSTLVQNSNRKTPRSTYVGRIRKARMGRFLTAIRDDLTLTYPTCGGDTFARKSFCPDGEDNARREGIEGLPMALLVPDRPDTFGT